MSKVSLEQWKMFVAVVEAGGFAQAGEMLFKTQPTISHGIHKIEQLLGKDLFNIQGRKAMLTPFGQSLLPQAKLLVSQAQHLEDQAISFNQPARQLRLAVDVLLPPTYWHAALQQVLRAYPQTNFKVQQSSLSRAAELLEDGHVDLAIGSRLPAQIISYPLTSVQLWAVVSNEHKLATSKDLKLDDLTCHRQIVISDMGLRQNTNSGWLGSAQRLSVYDAQAALAAVSSGLGYAWLPDWLISLPLKNGELSKLSLQDGGCRQVALQLGYYPTYQDDPLLQTLRDALLN